MTLNSDPSATNHTEKDQKLWQLVLEAGLVSVQFGAPFSFDQLESAAKEIHLLDDPPKKRLFDLTQCPGIELTTTALLNAGKEAGSWGIQEGNKIAILVTSQSDAGLLRIFSAHFSEQLVKVFLSENEALRWLDTEGEKIFDTPSIVDHKVMRLRGSINLDTILATQRQIRISEDFDPTLGILWDLRSSKIEESIEEVKEIAVFIAGNHNRDRSGHPSAILVDSHFMDLIVREMFKANDWPIEDVEVFKSYREAIAWLAISSS